MTIKNLPLLSFGIAALTLASTSAQAAPLPAPTDSPILVIGASFAEGKLPLDDMMQGPFGGSSVGFGSYMDLGDALSRQGRFVVNEAQAGATATDAIFVDAWANMNTLPDGLHPTPRSANRAAKRVIQAIELYEDKT